MALIACSEQVITVLLKSTGVLSEDIVEFSGRDLETFNVAELTDIGVVVILEPSTWNDLIIAP